MGEEKNKDALISFLNAVLSKTRKEKIEDVTIIENKELTKKLIMERTGRLDVRARLSDKTEIDIEVQLTDYKNMDKRTLFYWGKLFLEGIKKAWDRGTHGTGGQVQCPIFFDHSQS
jgi:predicted transposase/invertase (TIGR01784 family)